MTSQIALPVLVSQDEIVREKTLGGALELCAKAADFVREKTLCESLKFDKAQLSRWHNGTEGIIWPKFVKLMDACGNEAPLLWMLHQRGYDISSLRKRETEYQKRVRELEEELSEEKKKRAYSEETLRNVLVGRAA